MPTDDDWRAVVAAGIVDAPTAGRLAEFLAARRGRDRIGIEGVVDAMQEGFLALGLAVLLFGMWWLGTKHLGAPYDAAAPAITAWVLASWLLEGPRTTAPGFVLAALFTMTAGCLLAAPLIAFLGLGIGPLGLLATLVPSPSGVVLGPAFTVAALAFYLRFRLGVAVAGIAYGVLFAILSAAAALGLPAWVYGTLLAPGGAVVFAIALGLDLVNPGGGGTASRIAFWLQLLGATAASLGTAALAVLFSNLLGMPWLLLPALAACTLVLGSVGLALDRRAILVVPLFLLVLTAQFLYVGPIIVLLISLPLRMVSLGLVLVVLICDWRPARRRLLGFIPAPIARRLPPVPA